MILSDTFLSLVLSFDLFCASFILRQASMGCREQTLEVEYLWPPWPVVVSKSPGLPLIHSARTFLVTCLLWFGPCGQGQWNSHWLGLSYVLSPRARKRLQPCPDPVAWESQWGAAPKGRLKYKQKKRNTYWESQTANVHCVQGGVFRTTV